MAETSQLEIVTSSSSEEGLKTEGSKQYRARRCWFYYRGGFSTVVMPFFGLPMVIMGTLYLYDCPATDTLPTWVLTAGTIHLYFSSPFTGLLIYAASRRILMFLRLKKYDHLYSPLAHGALGQLYGGLIGYMLDVINVIILTTWVSGGIIKMYMAHAHHNGFDTENKKARNYCHPTILYAGIFFLVGNTVFVVVMACLVIQGCCEGSFQRTMPLEVRSGLGTSNPFQELKANITDNIVDPISDIIDPKTPEENNPNEQEEKAVVHNVRKYKKKSKGNS